MNEPHAVLVDAEEYRQLKAVVVAAAMFRGAYKSRIEYARSCNAGEQELLASYGIQLRHEENQLERAFYATLDGMPPALLRRLGIEALREHNAKRAADGEGRATPAGVEAQVTP